QNILLSDQGLVLEEGGINAAESLLIARTLMRPAVYTHHVNRIATSMVQRALIEEYAGKKPDVIHDLMQKDDSALMFALLHSRRKIPAMLAERVYSRNLYKRAIFAGPDLVNVAALQAEVSLHGERRIAAEIARRADVEDWQVLVDIPFLPADLSMGVTVRNRHVVSPLSKFSPVVEALNQMRKAQWRAGVYTPTEVKKQVEEAANEVLHVKKATKQDRLSIVS
ncbi:MAG: HD domain-containing protein, partial [Methanomicrobiales archaeon]|nr:HD domain-containing protein [Methanomicrobiales archaeon]